MVLPITYKWYFTTIIWTIISLQDKAEKWDFLIKFSKYLLKSPRLSIERINSKSCSPNILHICPKRSLLSCMDQITIVSSSEQAYQFANFYRGDNGDEAYNAMIIRNVASNANNWFLDWKKKRRMDACLDKCKLQRTQAGGGCNKSLVSHIPRSRINFACTCFSIESSMSFAIDFSTLHWSQDQLSIDWMIASKWFSMKEFLSAMLWFLPQIQAQFLRSKENLALKAGNTVLLKGDLRNLNFTWKSGLTFR